MILRKAEPRDIEYLYVMLNTPACYDALGVTTVQKSFIRQKLKRDLPKILVLEHDKHPAGALLFGGRVPYYVLRLYYVCGSTETIALLLNYLTVQAASVYRRIVLFDPYNEAIRKIVQGNGYRSFGTLPSGWPNGEHREMMQLTLTSSNAVPNAVKHIEESGVALRLYKDASVDNAMISLRRDCKQAFAALSADAYMLVNLRKG